MRKQDIEKDLKTLKVHGPPSDFASRVTMKAMQQMENKPAANSRINWIPWFCTVGFVSVFLVLLFLIVQYYKVEPLNANVILALQTIGIIGFGYFLINLIDQMLKRLFLG